MTFLNIILLAGIAGAAVPIAIHFFHRRRAQRVRWGAMELLDRTVGQNRRRMKFKQFLLLLARCLIPALLAFAMARPVLTRNRALLGHARMDTAQVYASIRPPQLKRAVAFYEQKAGELLAE